MPVGTTARLEMRWVPVTMPDGRTQMESVWVAGSRAAVEIPVETTSPSTTSSVGPGTSASTGLTVISGAQHAA